MFCSSKLYSIDRIDAIQAGLGIHGSTIPGIPTCGKTNLWVGHSAALWTQSELWSGWVQRTFCGPSMVSMVLRSLQRPPEGWKWSLLVFIKSDNFQKAIKTHISGCVQRIEFWLIPIPAWCCATPHMCWHSGTPKWILKPLCLKSWWR